jgi:hypothetical protein
MSPTELTQEVQFGLENLNKLHDRVNYISALEVDPVVKTSALTYECFGYYNAIEHIILRLTKYLKIPTPGGAFSHKEVLKNFSQLVKEREIPAEAITLNTILELMAFRHVATKIYAFLIDENKLEVIATKIINEHSQIVALCNQLLTSITQDS